MKFRKPKFEEPVGRLGGLEVYTVSQSDGIKPGGAVLFLPGEAEGALKNGTEIVKANTEAEDSVPNGTKGVVLASHDFSEFPGVGRIDGIAYFVEWENFPGLPVLIHAKRIAEARRE